MAVAAEVGCGMNPLADARGSDRKLRCGMNPLADARGSDQSHDRKGVVAARGSDRSHDRKGVVAARLLLLLICAFSARATTFYLTISGLGGEADYTQRFKMWADDIDGSLKRAGGEATVITLVAPTREEIRARLAEISRQAKPAGGLLLM